MLGRYALCQRLNLNAIAASTMGLAKVRLDGSLVSSRPPPLEKRTGSEDGTLVVAILFATYPMQPDASATSIIFGHGDPLLIGK